MRTLWIMAMLLVGVGGSLLEFGRMIQEETGKNPLSSYIFYGCYCDLGGQGRPRDATDRCYLMHDCCYENLTGCKTKTDPYPYSQENGVMVCGGDDPCKQEVCECDKAAAICFRDNLKTYNKEYQFYGDFRCKEGPKKC